MISDSSTILARSAPPASTPTPSKSPALAALQDAALAWDPTPPIPPTSPALVASPTSDLPTLHAQLALPVNTPLEDKDNASAAALAALVAQPATPQTAPILPATHA